jgi:hypothetical protein
MNNTEINIKPKSLDQFLEELEKMVQVPNVDKDPEGSINGMKMLAIIVNMRVSIKTEGVNLINWMWENAMQSEGKMWKESKEEQKMWITSGSHVPMTTADIYLMYQNEG